MESLIQDKANEDLREVDQIPDSNVDKSTRRNSLCSWLSLWASKRRKIRSIIILTPEGLQPASMEDSVQNLHDHWSRVFEGKPVNLAVADASIGPFIQTAPDGITWFQSFETLLDLIVARRNTGNDPDGSSLWLL